MTSTRDRVFDDLSGEARARLEALLAKRWSLPGEHPLGQLLGAALGEYRMFVLVGPKNNVGSHYFQLFVADGGGELSEEPLALGLHNSGGFPAFNWIELTHYREVLRVGGEMITLGADGLDGSFFELLAQFVPPGGHMMVEYDSPTHRATERILTLNYPQVCSPIGYLMFRIGCRSYRDWYISEGGREGPRKLQGFMPLNDEIKREKEAKMREELSSLIDRQAGATDEWGQLAGRTAREVLTALGGVGASS
jgi:hypothetical protein